MNENYREGIKDEISNNSIGDFNMSIMYAKD